MTNLIQTLPVPGTAGQETVTLSISPGASGIQPVTGGGFSFTTPNFTLAVLSVDKRWAPSVRPFSQTSQANLPLPTGVPMVRVPWPVANGFNYYTGVKNWLDFPASSVTAVCSFIAEAGWGHPQKTYHRIMTPGFTGHLHNPDGASTGDYDNSCVSIVGTNCASFFNFNRLTDTTAIDNVTLWGECDILNDTGFGVPGNGAGVNAAGTSAMMGALTKQEFASYPIGVQHLIGFSIIGSLCNPGFLYPAISGDGNSGNGFCQEGQVFAIPPGTAMPAGLSAYGQQMFWTLQNYGAFCNDTSGSITPYCVSDGWGSYAATSWTGADIYGPGPCLVSDVNLLWPLLYKTGYLFDGLLTVLSLYECCGPQYQLMRYTGPLMNVKRDSDSTNKDVGVVAGASGLLDSAAISTFCTGTTGRVSSYYGQINGHTFSSAGSTAPIVYQSGALKTINGKPALSFDGSTNYLNSVGTSGNFPAAGGNLYLNFLGQVADYNANYCLIGPDVVGGLELRIDATTGFVRLLKNGGATIALASAAVPLNAPVLIEAVYGADGSYSIWLNAVLIVSGTAALVSVTPANIQIGAGPGGTELFKGLIGSWLILSPYVPPSNPQRTISYNCQDFWGPLGTVIFAKDTFVGTNGTDIAAHSMDIGSGWTDQIGTFAIQSNSAVPNTMVGGESLSTFVGGAGGHYRCTVTPYMNAGNDYFSYITFRGSDASNFIGIVLEVAHSKIELFARIAGVDSYLATLPYALVSGTPYVFDVYLSGTSISFTVNGANLTTATSSFNETANLAGIRAFTTGGLPSAPSFNSMLFTT